MQSSENAGMSSANTSENLVRRKPKVSPAMFVRRRLGGPKARPEGVADGQQVEIPALVPVRWMTFLKAQLGYWILSGSLRSEAYWVERGREKLLSFSWYQPYCKPTQVGESRRLRRSEELSLRN